MGGRWWPDRRPPRSGYLAPRQKRGGPVHPDKLVIPAPPSAAPPPGRRDRGPWAPVGGGQVVRAAHGGMMYLPNRAEPPEWKEPRKRLQFPKATPKAAPAADKENAHNHAAPPQGKDLFGAKRRGGGTAGGLRARQQQPAAPQLRPAAEIEREREAARAPKSSFIAAAPAAAPPALPPLPVKTEAPRPPLRPPVVAAPQQEKDEGCVIS